jgi:hypothetical protein
MNNEQQQIIDEVYNNYLNKAKNYITEDLFYNALSGMGDVIEGMLSAHTRDFIPYSQEEFINKCKTDTEFSEKWGLKIEERELSDEESIFHYEKELYSPLRIIDQKIPVIPTKLITITRELSYDERFKIAYKNLELRKKFDAESAMLHYPSGHIKVMDDNNIPTNKTIESYE